MALRVSGAASRASPRRAERQAKRFDRRVRRDCTRQRARPCSPPRPSAAPRGRKRRPACSRSVDQQPKTAGWPEPRAGQVTELHTPFQSTGVPLRPFDPTIVAGMPREILSAGPAKPSSSEPLGSTQAHTWAAVGFVEASRDDRQSCARTTALGRLEELKLPTSYLTLRSCQVEPSSGFWELSRPCDNPSGDSGSSGPRRFRQGGRPAVPSGQSAKFCSSRRPTPPINGPAWRTFLASTARRRPR